MGDFVTVRMMSGGLERLGVPDDDERHVAAAVFRGGGQRRVILLLLVLFTVAAMMRMVDIRQELCRYGAPSRSWLLAAGRLLRPGRAVPLRPTLTILVQSFQGPSGGLTFPMNGVSVHWFKNLFEKQMVGDFAGSCSAR